MNSKPLKILAVTLSICWTLIGLAHAQSSRPGWGSTPFSGGVTFRVWAPNATSVYVPGQFNGWSTSATPLGEELTNGIFDGVWSADVSGVVTGQEYKYYINYSGGSVWKHDPQSRWVTSPGTAAGANDIIYDPTAFNWNGDRLAPPPLDDLVVYELHMGTFPAGSSPNRFVAATNKLDYLKSLGVNAVEVMPIAEFGNTGSSWGYDPAQIFAVDNSQYGGPDAFKTFVQACHLRGLAVLLDVVHNHYGPDDLDMWNFDGFTGTGLQGGIYFWESNPNLQITPWGDTRPNFSSPQVSSFVTSNIVMWLNECHVDGFRWDAPSAIINANDGSYIPAGGNLLDNANAIIHNNSSGKISIAEDVYNDFGFDSAWDTSYPYSFTPVLTNTVDANRDMLVIANAVQYNVRYGGNAGLGRVAFLESHDVVGDLNNGVRLVKAIDPATPNSYRARKLSTLGAAVTFTAPGIPMIFQGQEMLESSAFDSALAVDWTKTNTYNYIVQFYRDLIGVRRDLKGYTPGLKGNECSVVNVDNVNKVVAFDRWNSAAPNEEAVVIANFGGGALNNYALNFPLAGNWYVHLNSDSTNYGPDYGNIGSSVVTASGNPPTANLTVGPYSALVLSQTPDAPPQLTITQMNGSVTISWPSVYFDWVLATASSLAGNPVWVAVPANEYQTNGSTTSIGVIQPPGSSFYRLQKAPDQRFK
ncbi:MAG TPA: alpha-amylase family glycosyl hydrolase [Candidatus Angelobacter sp.]|nr:alpha-amylase family glycosyl hydrolase [Candidatus Angelobacter sp.]